MTEACRAPEIHRMQDFWATPSSGSHGKSRWQQTMGSMVLRLLLSGSPWDGVSSDDFQVRLCERGLRVFRRYRRDEGDAVLAALNGDFQDEVLVRSSWWCLDCNEGQGRREAILTVHLAKLKDRSWPKPFLEGKMVDAAELSADWVSLPPGKLPEAAFVVTGINPTDLLEDLAFEQTDDLLIIRLLLNEQVMETAKRHAPMSRLWRMDLTDVDLQICFLSDIGGPLLEGRLGGKIIPVQTDWHMTKVTQETAGVRLTRPALTVQLRKAPCSRRLWDEILHQASSSVALLASESKVQEMTVPQALHLGDLDDDKFACVQLGEPAHHFKVKGDQCFRSQDFDAAVDFYSKALEATPKSEKLLSNRSAAFAALGKFQAALDDALLCEELAPHWPKALFRQGLALRGLKRFDMAISAFAAGQSREPGNLDWARELQETEKLKAVRQAARAARGKAGY
eukprot:TRINITY_DN29135_c0_g1_i1.p1 TRINITY_DN29135_c0_g1~~TRINITY_DN29135_c0_g1_i1.p1  ORF type:complete len:453 (+),score=105.79 TRINITY_DN29135_c0_g1_i1:123-1481(+)